ncbi:hypothetical protein SAMN04488005_2539 [Yoonia tamlensis]|uniref:Uncharacterized protein n=1 Tax=Yoonia tamlensis TaxID=390270 RepID=A0A1I6HDL5_9RHOB|nr:hypothetical protein [Yoonia tamlensis]SFR52377.1 hypothetical protein SAMN04488005_2539 [Yoonia tamlensis]
MNLVPSKPHVGPSSGATSFERALRKILKSAPQDLWLDTIRRARFASHNPLVTWMLNQPECDFAVAVHAFYRSNPAQHLESPAPLPAHPNDDQIFATCLINWDTGSYRKHRLKVEDCDAPIRQISRLHQKVIARPRGSLPFQVPLRFLEPKGGTPLVLPESINPEIAPDLWALYAEAALDVPQTAPGLARKMANFMRKFSLG